jgi:hypothetical protein
MSLGPTITVASSTKEDTIKYSAKDFILGAGEQTGSPILDVKNFGTVTVFGHIGMLNGSGSLIVSGSFDGSTLYPVVTGSVFKSGSDMITITDAVPFMAGYLLSATAVSLTGSLFVSVRT